MSDNRNSFNEGLQPIMEASPPAPDWESLQFDSDAKSTGWGRWWAAAVAAVVVLVVGASSFLLFGGGGGTGESGDDAAAGISDSAATTLETLEGIWILESWQEGGEQIVVEVGENTPDEPWVEFVGDGSGTFTAWTGCNLVESTEYVYSAGFLTHGDIAVQAAGCESGAAGVAFITTLMNTPDGIEVLMVGDHMEWYGSNVEGISFPLTFRRSGAPTPNPDLEPTTTVPTEDLVAVATYNVAGVEVVTPTRLGELPDRATLVEFMTTVIDSGSGPELCLGGVMESLPPQCSGPIARDLDMEGWTEEANGVRWGDRAVTVTWPPVDGVVEVIEQSDQMTWDYVSPAGALPEECVGIDALAGAGRINDYANALGERNGGVYLAEDGTIVLQVVGDPGPHREALAEHGGACVVEVTRSEAEQRSIQDTIVPLLADIPEIGMYAASTGRGGRVELYVAVADANTARAVAALVDDPTAIRIVGMGILVH